MPATPRDVASIAGATSLLLRTILRSSKECVLVYSCVILGDMGRKLDVDQLVGSAEIAERLGVKRLQVIHDWRRRHLDFPNPVFNIGRTGVWYWPEVRAWAKKTGRFPNK